MALALLKVSHPRWMCEKIQLFPRSAGRFAGAGSDLKT
jgi:hypothetical protein